MTTAAPPAGAPPVSPGAAGFGTATPTPGAGSGKKRRGLVIALLVVALLAVAAAGAVGAALLLGSRGSDLTVTVERCRIAADGTVTAAGELSSDGGSASAVVTVEFTDAQGGELIETVEVDVEVPEGGTSPWRAEGSAGDDVQRVVCTVTDVTT